MNQSNYGIPNAREMGNTHPSQSMKRKFRVRFTRGDQTLSHMIEFSENDRAGQVKTTGDESAFLLKNGNPIRFTDVELDGLTQSVKEQAEEADAEYSIDEITGRREFRIRLNGGDFNAEYIVSYAEGNPVPLVTTPMSERSMPLPDGSAIPFDKVNATDLESFVASMAKSNGLNFEFADLHE
jgi:hypothetical protein